MEASNSLQSTLEVFYRCDKVVKDNLEGQILWTGPSKKQCLSIETEPRSFLVDPNLVDNMKKRVFESLQQQPFVRALLREGDSIGVARCEILYKDNNSWCYGLTEMDQDNLSLNWEIDIEEDELGEYAELWITVTLAVLTDRHP